MTDPTTYQISADGNTYEDVIALATDMPEPRGDSLAPFADYVTAASGMEYGNGLPTCQWQFDYLTRAMYTALMEFVGTGQSAHVWISTRTEDGSFAYFKAIMHRPKVRDERSAEFLGWRDVVIRFTQLEEVV